MSLTDEEKKRIEEEEKIREGVRKDKPLGVWGFLNSSFGIFVCSSLVLASFTTLFTYCQSSIKEKKENLEIILRVDDEIRHRLYLAESQLTRFESEMSHPATNLDEIDLPNNLSSPNFIQKRIVHLLNGETYHSDDKILPNQSIYLENRDKPFNNLISELKKVVSEAEKNALLCAAAKYQQLRLTADSADDFVVQRGYYKKNNTQAKNVPENDRDDMLKKEKNAIIGLREQLNEIRNYRWGLSSNKGCLL